MSPQDLLTKADLALFSERLTTLLQQVLPAVAAQDDFLTVEEAATLAKTSTKTVRTWIDHGKPDQKGKIIKLFTLEFSPGYKRIPRSALVAYGQGLGFDVSQLKHEQLPAMRLAS